LLALEKVCSVTKELAAVDSYVLRDNFDLGAQPVLEFYETDEFEGQTDNWVAPNLSCLVAMCRTAGFARAEFKKVLLYSASVACHRQWEPEKPRGARAELLSAVHNTNAGINFDTRRDEYLTIGFQTAERNLKAADVQPSIGGYGARPIIVKNMGGDLWQANFKLPPGLEPGWHEVGVAVRGGPKHAGCRIAVDVPLPECAPHIEGVLDGTTWKPDVLDLQYGRGLAIWCSGLPENADRNNVRVFLNGRRCPVEFLAPPGVKRQINVQVPEIIAPGPAELRLQIGGAFAAPARVRVQ
jgi:hypothetical protein